MLNERAIEKERAARLEAERISQLKDEFLATLGAELRAPLNVVLGWARLIESGRLSSDELVRGGRTIARNAQALARVVDDVLDLGNMMSANARLDAEETDFGEIVEAAVDSVEEMAQAKGVNLTRRLEPHACLLFGDPQRLQRMVLSLLSNAIKFTPRGGQITIELSRGRTDCELRVIDSGIGMRADFVERVFERFTRNEAGVRTPQDGLGLGLAIARRIAELHGGTIRATSEGEGSGATFTVVVPRLAPRVTEDAEDAEDARESRAPEAHPAQQVNLEGLRVLIVDDEPDSLEIARQVLGNCHADVATALSVEAALATLQTFDAQVLISDLNMPGRDGYALIQAIRAHAGPEKLPAAALTADPRDDSSGRVEAAGYQLHMPKPVEPAVLIRAVARLGRREPSTVAR